MENWKEVQQVSRYTTEVRYICETSAGLDESVGYMNIEQVIKNCLPKVFDFDFPIFDEKYRGVLETKILRHYYTREIAHETVGLWKLKLCTKLNEIMPYYNQLYKSTLLEFNPLYDVDLTRQHKTDKTGKTDTTSKTDTDVSSTTNVDLSNKTDTTDTGVTSNTSNRKNMYSDTPQGAITDLESGKYLTNATINNDLDTVNTSGNTNVTQTGNTETDVDSSTNTNMTSTQNVSDLENYIETVKGKQGTQSYASLLKEFRDTFLNIDMMVMAELSDLFFNLW